MNKDVYRLDIKTKDEKLHSFLFSTLSRMRSFWHDTIRGYQTGAYQLYNNIDFCWTYKNGVYHFYSGF